MLEDILKELIAIPSISADPAACGQVIEYVEGLLVGTRFTTKKGITKGVSHLTATTQKPNRQMVWFLVHLDVVPADKDLFQVRSDKNNYYGRGVFDMKGIGASVLAAAKKVATAKSNIGLMFTTDEEVGGVNGAGRLLTKDFKGAAVFVLDQGSEWVLQERMKGVLWLEIRAGGKAAHGARPWLGESANSTLIEFLHEFKTWFDTNLPQPKQEAYVTTYNIGTMSGGSATNQVAASAHAMVDVRFVSEEDKQRIIKAAHTVAAKHKAITIRKVIEDPCVDTDMQAAWLMRTKEFMKQLGIKTAKHGEKFGHGSTDGRFVAPLGIPVITTRPPGGAQHGADEWVSKQGLRDVERLCSAIMAETSPSL